MAKYKQITPTEYGKSVGLKLNAVTRAIREERKLEGVKEVKKHGRFYLLKVDEKFILK